MEEGGSCAPFGGPFFPFFKTKKKAMVAFRTGHTQKNTETKRERKTGNLSHIDYGVVRGGK